VQPLPKVCRPATGGGTIPEGTPPLNLWFGMLAKVTFPGACPDPWLALAITTLYRPTPGWFWEGSWRSDPFHAEIVAFISPGSSTLLVYIYCFRNSLLCQTVTVALDGSKLQIGWNSGIISPLSGLAAGERFVFNLVA
jgi:hypothetical protein